jgi:hypothetical protein
VAPIGLLLQVADKYQRGRSEHSGSYFKHPTGALRVLGSEHYSWITREEVRAGRRKLLEEHHSLYSALNIIRAIKSRRMRWARHVARIGGISNILTIFVRKPNGQRPLWRQRLRREDNTKILFK